MPFDSVLASLALTGSAEPCRASQRATSVQAKVSLLLSHGIAADPKSLHNHVDRYPFQALRRGARLIQPSLSTTLSSSSVAL